MFERAKEYLKFGAGRPLGTMWAMEKAYFEFRRRFPGREEYTYLRLTLQSRYPEKKDAEIAGLVEGCRNLEDAITRAVGVDFGHAAANLIRMEVLWNLPPCSRCGKYRALSTVDQLCYGCRKFPGFVACTNCHLYWDDSRDYCHRCGGNLWKMQDGPGVPMIPLGDTNQVSPHVKTGPEDFEEATVESQLANGSNEFIKLVEQISILESRCAIVWDASLLERRRYRELRRIDPQAARSLLANDRSIPDEDETLVADLDSFFDSLCSLYLTVEPEVRVEIRSLLESNKRLLGNLLNYAGRTGTRLKQTGNPELLLRGLAAASIEEGHSCQDYGHVLGQLYKSALDHGLEPSHFFSVVAKLSDNEMRGILENFETSKDFAVFVGPYKGGGRT